MQERPSSTMAFPSPPPYSPPPSYSRCEIWPMITSTVTSSSETPTEMSITGPSRSSHTGLPVYLSRHASLPHARVSQSMVSRAARHHIIHGNGSVGASASRQSLPSVGQVAPWRLVSVAPHRLDRKMARYFALALTVLFMVSMCALTVAMLNMTTLSDNEGDEEKPSTTKKPYSIVLEQTRIMENFRFELRIDRPVATRVATLKRLPFSAVTKRWRIKHSTMATVHSSTVSTLHLGKPQVSLADTTELRTAERTSRLPHLGSTVTASSSNGTEVDASVKSETSFETENPSDTSTVGHRLTSWKFLQSDEASETSLSNDHDTSLRDFSQPLNVSSPSVIPGSVMPQGHCTRVHVSTKTQDLFLSRFPATSFKPEATVEASSWTAETSLSADGQVPFSGTPNFTKTTSVTEPAAGNYTNGQGLLLLHGYNTSNFNSLRNWVRVI